MQTPQDPHGLPYSSQPKSDMPYDGSPFNQSPSYMSSSQPQLQYPPQYDGPPLNQPPFMQPPQQQYAQHLQYGQFPQYAQYPQYGQAQQYAQYPQYGQAQQYAQYPQYGQNSMNVANTSVNVNIQQKSHSFVVRALYYIFIGWWLGLLWLNIGFLFCLGIITLPIGLVMLNRLPQVLTLRSSGTSTNVNITTTNVQSSGFAGAPSNITTNTVNVSIGGTVQYNFLIRALYYVFIGWWAGYIWACIGYFFCLSLILFPIGLIMLNRLPMVLTLRKN